MSVAAPHPLLVSPVERAAASRTVAFATPRFVDLLVFVLLMSGPPQLRVRDAAASLRGETDAAIFFKLAVWGGGALWLLFRLYPLLVERGTLPRLYITQALGGLFVVILSLGVVIAPGPALTAVSVFQIAVMGGFALVFVRLYGPQAYVRYLFVGLVLLGVAIVLAWVLNPEMVMRRDRLRGDLIAPSGAVAVLGLAIALSGAVKIGRKTLYAVVGLCFVLLIAAQTRTAFAALLPCLALAWLFRYQLPMKKLLPVMVAAVLAAGLFDQLSVGQQYVVREEQSLATMSDRIPLWGHLLSTMVRESPAIGMGYFSASRLLGPQYNPRLGNAHSAFVEALVGGGLIGGGLFFALYAALCLYAARLLLYGRDHPLAFAVVSLFSITFLLSITNTDGIQGGPIGFTFWSLSALLPAVWEQVRERHVTRQVPRYAHPSRT
jgi:hypothetical protein